ncbi:hypothetical protein AGLY_014795 [Aphis glycines]|uniref:Uncharacterized protein n=1 Tax=Aphis glycines TaxID=307491 RepID=A0A6G0T324_APHGL|nr:hypothetical protein AGLY_014795 [Aphis glycines]
MPLYKLGSTRTCIWKPMQLRRHPQLIWFYHLYFILTRVRSTKSSQCSTSTQLFSSKIHPSRLTNHRIHTVLELYNSSLFSPLNLLGPNLTLRSYTQIDKINLIISKMDLTNKKLDMIALLLDEDEQVAQEPHRYLNCKEKTPNETLSSYNSPTDQRNLLLDFCSSPSDTSEFSDPDTSKANSLDSMA